MARQALYQAAVNEYDLVILDVMLPMQGRPYAFAGSCAAADFARPFSC